jgi:hypothetical protein
MFSLPILFVPFDVFSIYRCGSRPFFPVICGNEIAGIVFITGKKHASMVKK